MTENRMKLGWPSERTLLRWIGPACIAALGAGALVGAIWYRFDVPVVTTQGFTSTVTQTVTPAPETLVETRTVKDTVVVPGPAPAPVTQAAVTITKTPEAPEPQVVIKKNVETTTVTETVTNPADAVLNVGRRGKRGDGNN
jgi:hypothetical protein